MNLKAGSPRIILGTMDFGRQLDQSAADRMVGMFLDRGFSEIDTAYKYVDGAAEETLGRILTPDRRGRIYLATKAHPSGGGGLRPENITMQIETSLLRLKTDHVDLFYLHLPDLKTPIEATLETCQKLFKAGKFRELGVSNYPAWQVANIWHVCGRNGWVSPSVYQGIYNAITRDAERELFPALLNFRIRFYAYNPLAGGFLTGRYTRFDQTPQEGRFKLQQNYLARYWKPCYFEAVEIIRNATEQAGMSMVQAALRWILHRSCLRGQNGDGIIIAASNLEQWEANLKSLSGELPQEVAEAIDRAWEKARPECPSYFRA